ncbi:DUF2514 domain-containing protein [Erwinia sp. HR93]|uniref:DUF2514 domain-containing protein n=1 Tax=Erwinia sp. HR93 TaxID=3094840 RepID=UPI002ADEE55D|nr:DUF2514 domain-containing protein [Erwinia sp. HR93]MEA1064727.1 DUF2514 domain-containing protein [Erwinia sp. HR93]
MTAFLVLLKKYWKPLAIFLLMAFLLWRSYSTGFNSADTAWKLRWAQRDLSDSTAALHRDISERAEEQRRQSVINEEQKRADDELAKAQANVDAARRAGYSLQQQLSDIRARYGRSETGRLSALASASEAKAETARVLAELLSESGKRAGIYATEADRAFIAGQSCERIYDAVREKK